MRVHVQIPASAKDKNKIFNFSLLINRIRYLLACLNNSVNVMECGTSFGVSTLYLALAVKQNLGSRKDQEYGVVTIEKDAMKLSKAKSIWREAGAEVEGLIKPREGDVKEVLLAADSLPPTVDLLFLDGGLMGIETLTFSIAYGVKLGLL